MAEYYSRPSGTSVNYVEVIVPINGVISLTAPEQVGVEINPKFIILDTKALPIWSI